MKFAVITDTHLGARHNDVAIMAHQRRFFDEVFFPALKERKIQTVLHCGDLFEDRKQTAHSVLKAWDEFFFRPLDPYVFFGIVGNHDSASNNSLNINALDLVLPSRLSHCNIIQKPKLDTIHGERFLFLPWICEENVIETIRLLKEAPVDTAFGHFQFAGYEMYRGVTVEKGQNIELFKRFRAVYSGHYHHKSDRDNIHYLGSSYETCWSDYGDPRGFHLYDTDTHEMEFVRNPITLHEKLYYNEDIPEKSLPDVKNKIVQVIVEKRTDNKKYDAYLEALNAQGPVSLLPIENFSDLIEEQAEDNDLADKTTLQIIHDYIDQASTELADKGRLKTYITGIYNEAVHAE